MGGRCCSVERECVTCGRTFKGHTTRCGRCRSTERECGGCGRTFVGRGRRCSACCASDRVCFCGRTFVGRYSQCAACRLPRERTCVGCGETFVGDTRECRQCRRRRVPAAERSAIEVARSNARRARKAAAEVAGPVPADVYAAIRAEGPCVYCGAPAEHVDHVRPLTRGGREHADNLVPACGRCNRSKHDRLLTEWNAERVAHGAMVSDKVRAELVRLMGEVPA